MGKDIEVEIDSVYDKDSYEKEVSPLTKDVIRLNVFLWFGSLLGLSLLGLFLVWRFLLGSFWFPGMSTNSSNLDSDSLLSNQKPELISPVPTLKIYPTVTVRPTPTVTIPPRSAKEISEIEGLHGNIIYGEAASESRLNVFTEVTKVYELNLVTGESNLLAEYENFNVREFSPDGGFMSGVVYGSDARDDFFQVREVKSGDVLFSEPYEGGPWAQDVFWFPSGKLVLVGHAGHTLLSLITGKVLLEFPSAGVVSQSRLKFNREMDYFVYDYVDNFFVYEPDGSDGTEAIKITGETAEFVTPKSNEMVFECWDSHKIQYRNSFIPSLIPTPPGHGRNMCRDLPQHIEIKERLEEEMNRDIDYFGINKQETAAVLAVYSFPGRNHTIYGEGDNEIYVYDLKNDALYKVGSGAQGVFAE